MYANDNNVVSFFKRTEKTYARDPILMLVDDLMADLEDYLGEEGYTLDNTESVRDFVVIGEFLKAMLYRFNGDYHVYQEFLDQIEVAAHVDDPK